MRGIRCESRQAFTREFIGRLAANLTREGGLVAAIPVGSCQHNEGGSAALSPVLLMGVPAGIGYLIGWSADRNAMEIPVQRQPPSK